MLHFFWTRYMFVADSYLKYEYSNNEIVKYARRYFERVTPTHITDFLSGRVTDNNADILLGHPTWGITTNNWVKENALSEEAECHPNTYIMMPWLPVFPKEFIMPYVEEQLLAARKIFAICGNYWIERTMELENSSIQARVKNKLIQNNMGCRADLIPFRNDFGKSSRSKLLHVSNFGSTKNIGLLFNSLKTLDVDLCIASPELAGKVGEQNCTVKGWQGQEDEEFDFISLGSVSNSEPAVNDFINNNCGFYIHTSNYDAQATTILENCARGLIPIVTRESGFECEHAVYLSQDAEENRDIISKALKMGDEEFEHRSKEVRKHILEHHDWDKIYAKIWEEINKDQKQPAPSRKNKKTPYRKYPLKEKSKQKPGLKALKAIVDGFIETKNYESAERELLKAISSYPENCELLSRLGLTYALIGNFDKSMKYHQRVIKIEPNNPDAHFNAAVAHVRLGERKQAVNELEQTIALDPLHYNAINYLGTMLSQQGDKDGAMERFLEAIEIDEKRCDAHINLSGVYKDRGDFGQAVEQLKKAMEDKPVKPIVYNNLANVYLRSCRHEEGIEMYEKSMEKDPDLGMAGHNYLLSLHYNDYLKKDDIFSLHKSLGKKLESSVEQYKTYSNLRISKRRLRVGYVSGDFRKHPVSLFMESIIRGHDRNEIEPFLYYTHHVVDDRTFRFLEMVPATWRDISTLYDSQAADLIRTDRIDILVDLSGHTSDTRLGIFAKKPAPVQISYLGYPDTTGLTVMDYRLTDEFCDPKDESDQFHTEKLIRIADSFLCFTPDNESDVGLTRTADSSGIVFGCFNNSSKINPNLIRLWSRILKAVPGSTLLLKSYPYKDSFVADYLVSMFEDEGVDKQRIILEGFTHGREGHLDQYNSIDIALDPFPYNGTTTTLEALYMGCPVVTLKGDRHSSRVSYSILKNIGLEEFAAEDGDQYVGICISLASDTKRLNQLKGALRQRLEKSVLMDGAGFVEKLENIYRDIWEKWLENKNRQEPAVIKVKSDISVFVPDSYQLMTPFVLWEQEDWFEEDLQFIRKYVKPGLNVLDIGANYGLYTLNIAKKVGMNGKVAAFEPSSSTSAYLKMSIKDNGFRNVEVYEAGLSRKRGSAMLSLNPNSELNSICRDANYQGDMEHICLLSLDEIYQSLDFQCLDLIKMDAEGEEPAILEGGNSLLASESPLIMYELAHGQARNFNLVSLFKEIDYDSYRLIPGLGVLAPFHNRNDVDGYTLNLYACKKDRADRLVAENLLCQEPIVPDPDEYQESKLQNYLESKPYCTDLKAAWSDPAQVNLDGRQKYVNGLYCFIRSKESDLTASEKVGFLRASFNFLKEVGESFPTLPRLLSLIRVATDAGERAYAVRVLKVVLDLFDSSDQLSITEEHLALSERYENLPPGETIGQWYLSMVLEHTIKTERYSSFFDQGGSSLSQLELLKKLGFQSHEMERRRQLLKLRAGSISQPQKSELLSKKDPGNLNWQWWVEKAG